MPLPGLSYAQYYSLPIVLASFEKLRPIVKKLLLNLNPSNAPETVLNPSATELATLTGELLQFQGDHLGPVAVVTKNTEGIVRIPGKLFRETITLTDDDHSDDDSFADKRKSSKKKKRGHKKKRKSVPSPALACILATAWQLKISKGWKSWEFKNKDRESTFFDLIKAITEKLKSNGYMEVPKIAIHPNVQKQLANELVGLINQLHGVVVPMTSPEVTHILYPSSDVDYGDQEFYRTLEKSDALVCLHYWYRPDSADVWLINSPGSQFLDPEPAPDHTGPWRITTKWINDSVQWNEWMNEEDYETEDQVPTEIVPVTVDVTSLASTPATSVENIYDHKVKKLKTTETVETEMMKSPVIKIKMPKLPVVEEPPQPPPPPIKISLAVRKPPEVVAKESREAKKARLAQEAKAAREAKEEKEREFRAAKEAKAAREALQAKLAQDEKEAREKAREKEKEAARLKREAAREAKLKEKQQKLARTNSVVNSPSTPPAKKTTSNLNTFTPTSQMRVSHNQFYSTSTPFAPGFVPNFQPMQPLLQNSPMNPLMRPVFMPSFMSPTPVPPIPNPTVPLDPWWKEHPYPLFKITDLDARPLTRTKKIEYEPINEAQGGVLMELGRNRGQVLKLGEGDEWVCEKRRIEKEQPWYGVGVGFVVGGVKIPIPASKPSSSKPREEIRIELNPTTVDAEMEVNEHESKAVGFVSEETVAIGSDKHNEEDMEIDEDEQDARHVEQFILKTIENRGVNLRLNPPSPSKTAQRTSIPEIAFQIEFAPWFHPKQISERERTTFPELLQQNKIVEDEFTPMLTTEEIAFIETRYRRVRNAVVFHHIASQLYAYVISKGLPPSSIPTDLTSHNVAPTSVFSLERCWNGLMWYRDPLSIKKISFPENLSSLNPRRSGLVNVPDEERTQAMLELQDEIETAELALMSNSPEPLLFWLSRLVTFWEYTGILGYSSFKEDERPCVIKSTEVILLRETPDDPFLIHDTHQLKLNTSQCYFCKAICLGVLMSSPKLPGLKICSHCFADGVLPSELPSSELARVEPVSVSDSKLIETGIISGVSQLDLSDSENPWTVNELRRLVEGVEKYCKSLNDKNESKQSVEKGRKSRNLDIGVPHVREWAKVAAYVGGKRTKEQCLLAFASLDMESLDDWLAKNDLPEKEEPDTVPPLADEEEEELLLKTLDEIQHTSSFPSSAVSSPKLRRRSTRISAASTTIKDYAEWDEDEAMEGQKEFNDDSAFVAPLQQEPLEIKKEVPEIIAKKPLPTPIAASSTEDMIIDPVSDFSTFEFEEAPPKRVLSSNNPLSQTPLVDVANPLMWLLKILGRSLNPGIAAAGAKSAMKAWGNLIQKQHDEEIGEYLEEMKELGLLKLDLPMTRKRSKAATDDGEKEEWEEDSEEVIDVANVLAMFRKLGIPIETKEDAEVIFGKLPTTQKNKVRFASDVRKKSDRFDFTSAENIDAITKSALEGAIEQAKKLAEFEELNIRELVAELEESELALLEMKLGNM